MPLVKAADHNPREQQQFDQQDEAALHVAGDGDPDPPHGSDEPAVVVDTGVHETTPLGGVAAYQAVARHAIEALGRDPLAEDDPTIKEAEEPEPWRLGNDDS
ncbi:hypothetical protein [Breoghania sp.]|uniref:hypothetical protein n=1 Tax=Breoghania sp. TaxID=2065378 RepID=UPI0026128D23|nr:hypothetical protein [Breoghania sp.]MDJ0930465.1 hypothetical protein [Breoghania sp.]